MTLFLRSKNPNCRAQGSVRVICAAIAPLLATIAVLPTAANAAGTGVFDSIGEEVNRIFESASPAVVKVRTVDGSRPRAGSGFFIDDAGTILTSYAVILDSDKAWVEFDDRKLTAQILGRDPRSGVAVLKVDGVKTPFLKMGNSDSVKMASGLVSVAFPFNLPSAPAFGFVTGFDVRYLNRFFATTHIRSNIPISPGQIGGPVLNTRGEVIGMLVLAIQDGKECYALPSNSAARIVGDIKRQGKATHGWVGVGVIEGNNTETGDKPVVITNLFRGTPAAKSGLQPGDVVKKIGSRSVRTPSDILDAAFFSEVGKPVPVEIVRDGKPMVFSLPIVERPEAAAAVNSLVAPGTDTLIAPYLAPSKEATEAEAANRSGNQPKASPVSTREDEANRL